MARETEGCMPKVRKPKRGWPRIPILRRIRRRFREPNSGHGLPPCPHGGCFAMKRDDSRSEIYCTECGGLLGR